MDTVAEYNVLDEKAMQSSLTNFCTKKRIHLSKFYSEEDEVTKPEMIVEMTAHEEGFEESRFAKESLVSHKSRKQQYMESIKNELRLFAKHSSPFELAESKKTIETLMRDYVESTFSFVYGKDNRPLEIESCIDMGDGGSGGVVQCVEELLQIFYPNVTVDEDEPLQVHRQLYSWKINIPEPTVTDVLDQLIARCKPLVARIAEVEASRSKRH